MPHLVLQEVRLAANQVSEILSQYITIHDAIFKSSIRKVIPILGVFKPIRFSDHFFALSGHKKLLEVIKTTIAELQNSKPMPKEVQAFLAVLAEFVVALCVTIRLLKDICERFVEKSSVGREYKYSEYDGDVQNYENSVQHYLHIAERLDALKEPAQRCWNGS